MDGPGIIRAADNVIFFVCPGDQKFPRSGSLLIEDERTCLIDPGWNGDGRFDEIKGEVDLVLVSHFHADHHAAAGSLNRPVLIHESEETFLTDENAFYRAEFGGGPNRLACIWKDYLRKTLNFDHTETAGTFSHRREFDLGVSTVEVIHTPGHTRGHCAFMIRPSGILYAGDIDPAYYGGYSDALNDLRKSYRKLKNMKAETFITAHSRLLRRGTKIVRSYERVLDRRTEILKNALDKGTGEEDLCEIGYRLIFGEVIPPPPEVWKHFGNKMIDLHLREADESTEK